MVDISIQAAEQGSAEALEISQSRGSGLAAVLAGALMGGLGVWMLLTMTAVDHGRFLAAPLLVAGAAIATFGAVAVARPGRLIVSADGLYLATVFGSHAVAWEEIMAIGRRSASHQTEPSGPVRIALFDRAPIDLTDWPIAPDALLAILTEARDQFIQLPASAEPSDTASAADGVSAPSSAPQIVETA